MCRVADHCLIEIPDLDSKATARITDGTEVSDVAVTTNPNRRPARKSSAVGAIEPFVETFCTSSHIGVGGRRHFAVFVREEQSQSVFGKNNGFHDSPCQELLERMSKLTNVVRLRALLFCALRLRFAYFCF